MRLITKYLFIILVLLGSSHLLAQNGNNPFELKHRQQPTSTEIEPTDIQETDNRLIKSNNPFDVVEQPIITPKPTPSLSSPQESNSKIKEVISETSKNYLFWTFFVVFAFFTTVVALARKRLEQSYQAFLNDNYLRQLHRVNQGKFSFGYFLLYLLFFINAGIFIFLAANYFNANLPKTYGSIALVCLGVGIAFLIKHGLLFYVEKIFPVSKEVKLYSFTIMIFSIILGIALLPINIFAAFASEGLTKIAIWIGLGAILAIYSFRSLRGLSIGSRYVMLHSFHFLLYLCAVEILPVLILIKFVLLRID